jgi:hypothetical protein
LPDGKFTEVGDKAGIASMATARGAALADFNLDGLVDLVVVNRNSGAQLWRNTTEGAGKWVEVRLAQPAPNVDGIGAWVEVRCGGQVMRREITVGGGHASGRSGWHHFGIGGSERAELRVTWPDGEAGAWQPVEAKAFYIVARGQAPKVWQPR